MLRLALCGLAMMAAMFAGLTLAGTERYDYDALGRLVRVIDEQGRVTEYVYDPAGNILRVIVSGAGSSVPPSVASISPGSIRRGQTRSFVITGTGLTGSKVSVANPGLLISSLRTSATQVTFDLTALADAALGATSFSLSNAGGSASVQIAVNPVLPVLAVDPVPIALVTGGAPRDFTVSLSNADGIPHVVSVVMADTAIATVSPASITFAAGQTQAAITITPLALGRTTLDFTSVEIQALSASVGVGPALLGESASVSRPMSVHLRAATPGAPAGNAMSASQAASVHLPAATPGAPAGNAMNASAPVSVHLPATTPGTPPGNSMSVSQPASVSMP